MTTPRIIEQQKRDKGKDISDRLHIALIDFDFAFTKSEIKLISEFWEEGKSLQWIAAAVNREVEEVVVLLLDIRNRKKIKLEEWGL